MGNHHQNQAEFLMVTGDDGVFSGITDDAVLEPSRSE